MAELEPVRVPSRQLQGCSLLPSPYSAVSLEWDAIYIQDTKVRYIPISLDHKRFCLCLSLSPSFLSLSLIHTHAIKTFIYVK